MPGWKSGKKKQYTRLDVVAEALMLAKYRDLAFYDPDDKVTCTVYYKNLEWVKKTQEMKGSRNR